MAGGEAAVAWILGALRRELGAANLGEEDLEIVVERDRVWGSLWTVTAQGRRFWFKRPHACLRREVPLRRVLSARAPGELLSTVAACAETGWQLTADQGPVLAQRAREDGPSHYVELARSLARVQKSLTAADVAELRNSGLPVFETGDAVARLDEQLGWFSGLPAGHPAQCTAAERERAIEGMSVLVERWAVDARMLEGVVSELSVDHNDLHGGNAFVTAEGVRLSDWGDTVLAHPFASLRALLVPVRNVFETEAMEQIRGAYLAEWGLGEDVGDVLDLAMMLAVPQRLSCWSALADADAWAEYAEYIAPLWREIGTPVAEVEVP